MTLTKKILIIFLIINSLFLCLLTVLISNLPAESEAISIIGGADGPTSIYFKSGIFLM